MPVTMSDDTEILLVSLISILEPNVPSQSDLLNALVDCNGNVEAAAQVLRMSSSSSSSAATPKSSKRRRRSTSTLDSWMSTSKDQHTSPKPDNKKRRTEPPRSAGPLVSRTKPLSASTPTNNGRNAFDLLKAPVESEKALKQRQVPLTLATPELVARHTPCTLRYSVLPPELACELFYTMVDEAKGWSRNKWFLFDKLVESPHRTSFFARVEGFELEGDIKAKWDEAARFWYNGRETAPPTPFPEVMEKACQIVERLVSEELSKRIRHPLEWAGHSGPDKLPWRANVAASNCYQGTKESVGFHSDQLTYLGPYPTIASISLGTSRIFRLREVIPSSEVDERQARTYNIPLPHNSLLIMHASTQENFKHAVPPQPTIDLFRPQFSRRNSNASEEDAESSNCRINITFRFYRPDFVPTTTPRCKCGHPCILRPDMRGRNDVHSSTSKSADRKGKEALREDTIRYWWACYAGAQDGGKGCGMWKVMDIEAEGRGPFIGDSFGVEHDA